MIIGRFKIRSRPERAEEIAVAIAAVEAPSRALPGVVHFDIVRSLTEPDTFMAVEVFEDRQAFDRQNAQEELAELLRLINAGAVIGDYEWTTWEATPSG